VKRDIKLIELFLLQYRDSGGEAYRIVEYPEEVEREKPAVEAIAENSKGQRLAIEHTLVQPFEGQRDDDRRFLAGFEGLHHSTDLCVPGMTIEIIVRVDSIPKKFDSNKLDEGVRNWFKSIRSTLREGEADYQIPDLGFELTVHISTRGSSDDSGVLVVSRIRPHNRPFRDVLSRALRKKLPKLVGTGANSRILLLEDASVTLGTINFVTELDAMREEFNDFEGISAIWLVQTASWDTKRTLTFSSVWPDGVGKRFRIDC
jgi:hypothetical protein